MIAKMAKIRIIGPKTLLPTVIETLQDRGVVHIESKPAEIGRLAAEIPVIRAFAIEEGGRKRREELERRLDQVKKILLFLPAAPAPRARRLDEGGPARVWDPAALLKAPQRLETIAARAEALVGKRKVHEDERSLLARYEKSLQALAPLIAMVRESRDLESVGLVIQAKEREVLPLLDQALAKLTGAHYEIFYREVDEETLAGLLVFPKEKGAPVKALLLEKNIGELRLPASVSDKPLGEALRIILRKRETLPEKIKRIDLELGALSRRWRGALRRLQQSLEGEIARILVSASFFETRMTFLIYGWVPQQALPPLREEIEKRFGGEVMVERLPVAKSEEEEIPVLLRNVPLIRPFERFTRLLPLPRYGTIDPTPFIALFFPLFFGMIIGDIGYGLILLVAALLIRKRARTDSFIGNLAEIFLWAAASAIIWGIAYGELFGNLGERFGVRPLLFNRMEDFLEILFFSLAVGAAHILLGIGLGLFIFIRSGRRREAMTKLIGLFLLAAFSLALAGMTGLVSRSAIFIGLAGLLVGFPLLIAQGGASAAMELHNLVNILSYLRIMGIGVASVALAFAANKLSSLAPHPALGVLIGVSLHAINLAFCVVSPTIQSLRLHYVEFFENFFQGGGREYRPFKRTA